MSIGNLPTILYVFYMYIYINILINSYYNHSLFIPGYTLHGLAAKKEVAIQERMVELTPFFVNDKHILMKFVSFFN